MDQNEPGKLNVPEVTPSERSFSTRRDTVRAANAALGLASTHVYKNGQVSDLEDDSAWDNFDRYFKFTN